MKFFWADRLERDGCANHNAQIRKWRVRLNTALDEIKRLDEKLNYEKLRDRPNDVYVIKMKEKINKQRAIIDKYRVTAKREW